jgi:glycerol-3-phosphate acyltransferase PlsX
MIDLAKPRGGRLMPVVAVDATGAIPLLHRIARAAAHLSRDSDVGVILVGEAGPLQGLLDSLSYDPSRLRIEPLAPHGEEGAGLVRALTLAKAAQAHAVVTLAPPEMAVRLASAHLAMLPGVSRPPLAAVYPTAPRGPRKDPFALLLDVGARCETTSADLICYARLGATYARVITGLGAPTVALLSTGPNPQDGPPAVGAAHPVLAAMPDLRFVGNLRAVDLLRGRADVVVTDGFTGHTVAQLLASLTQLTVEAARFAWRERWTWRVGLRLLGRGVAMLRRVSEFDEYGGAPVLGLESMVIVSAPESGARAIENSIRLAARCVRSGLVSALAASVAPATLPEHP